MGSDHTDIDGLLFDSGEGPSSSQVSVWPDSLSGSYSLLREWLGSFWNKIYSDHKFVDATVGAHAINVAQLCLDELETLRLAGRRNAPITHRERWLPILIDFNGDETPDILNVRLGADPGIVLGPQPDTTEYVPGSVYEIGGNVSLRGAVAYAAHGLDADISGSTCIVDSPIAPKTVLMPGIDYVVSGTSIAISEKYDPFADGSTFLVETITTDDPERQIKRATLWACNAEIDRNYVSDHISSPVGFMLPSTERGKALANAVWDVMSSGATSAYVSRLLAVIAGVPCVSYQAETVERVATTGDGTVSVVTDKEVLTLHPGSHLREGIEKGAKLAFGDFVDDSVRIYRPSEYGLLPYRLTADVASAELARRLPALDIPGSLLGDEFTCGFRVGWAEEPITVSGFDYEGRPLLRFRIDSGAASDDTQQLFWERVWARCTAAGMDMRDMFKPWISADAVWEAGVEVGRVSPIIFMLKRVVGQNTLVVSADLSRLPRESMLSDPSCFHALASSIPAGMRMVFCSCMELPDENASEAVEVDDSGIVSFANISETDTAYCGTINARGSDAPGALYIDDSTVVRVVPCPARGRRTA